MTAGLVLVSDKLYNNNDYNDNDWEKILYTMEIVSFFHLVLNSLDMIGHFLMTAISSENVATYLSLQPLTI